MKFKNIKSKLLIAIISIFVITSCASQSNTQQGSVFNKLKNKIKPNQEPSKESLLSIPYRSLDTSKTLTKIAFGSCADQTKPQPIWTQIAENKPELFIFSGDNIYASHPNNQPIMDQYILLNKIENYKKFREETPFLAIWDDHDFGQNDGGTSNPNKDEARRVFLNYWGYLKQSLPTEQKALYHSRIIGEKNKKVQIIMLDTRWDRSDFKTNPEFNPATDDKATKPSVLPESDKKARILSDEQWAWLENELKKPAQLRIIVSSIQVLANDHYFEKWGNFPLERERFFNLLKKTKVKNTFVVSGDRHMSVVAKKNITGWGDLYDITVSSINRPLKTRDLPQDETYISSAIKDPNFGILTINWENKTGLFEIKDENNKTIIEQMIKFN